MRVGVDLGGTKTEAVVMAVEANEPRVPSRVRAPTARAEGYRHVVENTAAVIDEAARVAGLRRCPPVGVGMPGSVTFRGAGGRRSRRPLVKNSNTTCLNGRRLFDDLRSALGRDDVAYANDANCFAPAQSCFGAGRGGRVVFGVIIGTGVGGGVVFGADEGRGRAWEGAQSIAGEWGHVTLDPERGPPCYCGRRGCVEQ